MANKPYIIPTSYEKDEAPQGALFNRNSTITPSTSANAHEKDLFKKKYANFSAKEALERLKKMDAIMEQGGEVNFAEGQVLRAIADEAEEAEARETEAGETQAIRESLQEESSEHDEVSVRNALLGCLNTLKKNKKMDGAVRQQITWFLNATETIRENGSNLPIAVVNEI